MSDDELQLLVEGTIVDATSFTEKDNAQEFMDRTLDMLRAGMDMQEEAERLLKIAAEHGVWQVLGFDSWEECLTHEVAKTFKISLSKAARQPIVLSMRHQMVNTDNIAKAVGAHPSTVTRDLNEMREAGLLEDEPEKVVTRDGRSRPTAQQARRPDFKKSWFNWIHRVVGTQTTGQKLREDDRYHQHMFDLATSSRSDLQRTRDLLNEILGDFEIVPTSTIEEPEN